MVKRSPLSEAGFTLVEILCVLALLGLTAGLVVLNLPKPKPAFQTEVAAAAMMLNLAARNSIIDGKTRGLDVSNSGFEIFKYDGEWVSEGQRHFTAVNGIDMTVEQLAIDLGARQKQKEREKVDLPPLIFFDATGNVTPFHIALEGAESSYVLKPDARGRVIVENLS